MSRDLLDGALEYPEYLVVVVEDDALWRRVVGVVVSARDFARLRQALTGLDVELYDQAVGLVDPLGSRDELERLRVLRKRVAICRAALLEIAAGLRRPADPLPEPAPPPEPLPPARRGGRGNRSPVTAAEILETARGGRVKRLAVARDLGISDRTMAAILRRAQVSSPWARPRGQTEGARA